MSTKLTKEEVRSPDKFSIWLQTLVKFIEKNVAVIGGILLVFLLAGGGWTLWEYLNNKKEVELQGKVAISEKEYLEKRDKFKQAEQAAAAAKEEKKSKDKKKDATKKDPEKPEPATPQVASGDLQKDYGSVVKSFQDVVSESPNSKASQMAAIYLAEIYSDYKDQQKALEVLEKVSTKNTSSSLVSGLVLNMKAGLLADQGQCPKALEIWNDLANNKKLPVFAHEAKLRMAVCYEKTNDLAKAEKLYEEIKNSKDEERNPMVAEAAGKYLRLLKLRSSGATTETTTK